MSQIQTEMSITLINQTSASYHGLGKIAPARINSHWTLRLPLPNNKVGSPPRRPSVVEQNLLFSKIHVTRRVRNSESNFQAKYKSSKSRRTRTSIRATIDAVLHHIIKTGQHILQTPRTNLPGLVWTDFEFESTTRILSWLQIRSSTGCERFNKGLEDLNMYTE